MEATLWLLGVCLMSGGMFVAVRGEAVVGVALLVLGILVGPGGTGLIA